MQWFIKIQRWLYGGMSDSIRSADDVSGLAALMSAAFLFGIVHALMPGHGKSVLVSYHVGRASRLIEGVATGTLLAATHVGIAVIFVLAGVAVISRSLAAGGRAPAFEALSAALISLIGAYLLVRTLWPRPHTHASDGKSLAVATGLIPCPLTTFLLTFALAQNKLAVGLAAVIAMLGGIIVTLVSFAVAAVIARERFLGTLARTEKMRARVGFWLELAGAVAVFGLGVVMLVDRLPRAWIL
ncbi:MAG: nickel/cobalt transporter [Hyphomicrobium sp.]